jgi:DNA polymerase-3 subunit delta'
MLFKEVIGQNKVKKMLIESVNSDRISHAQMFLGDEGFGGMPLSIAYAQYILCTDKANNESCSECASCKKVSNLSHPDLHFSFPIQLSAKEKSSDVFLPEWKEMMLGNPYSEEEDWYAKTGNENKQGVIGKDESQSVFKKLQLKSYEGNYKIMIIWLADKMNASAANKLLKLLEEPPNKTLFLLTAKNIENILPTIISRTQITKLPKLSINEITKALISKEVESETASDTANFVDGDFAQALKQIKGSLNDAEYYNFFVKWMRICFSRDVALSVEISNELSAIGREKQKSFIAFSLDIFQKSLRGNFIGLNNIKVNPNHVGFISKFMPFITPNNALAIHEYLTNAYYHIDRNANPKILFLDLSFKLFTVIKK